MEYTSDEALETLIKEVLDQPPEVIEQARKYWATSPHCAGIPFEIPERHELRDFYPQARVAL